jgi:molybdenum cofactor synthesis domain-containing protein
MVTYVSLEEAISLSCDNITSLDSEYINIEDACLRVAADNIISPINVPDFNRSAMDGYTLAQADLEKLKNGNTVSLKISGTIKAGSIERRLNQPGETYKIMTGALLPEGSRAVIKQEDVKVDNDYIIVASVMEQGDNIQKAGHDVRAGDMVIRKGQIIKAELLERAAACGIHRVKVYRIPRVYIINTGSELRWPGSALEKGQIYGSNRYLLTGKIISSGAIPVLAASIIEDDLKLIVSEMEKAVAASDMIIISGGTGNGLYDLVFQAFEQSNSRILFRGINIIPGKGTSAAIINGKALFNLSGSPFAAAILFETLIRPALNKLKGDLFSNHPWFNVELGSSMQVIKSGRSLHRGEMIINENGYIYAKPVSRKDYSHHNFPVILDIPAGKGYKGDMVKARFY